MCRAGMLSSRHTYLELGSRLAALSALACSAGGAGTDSAITPGSNTAVLPTQPDPSAGGGVTPPGGGAGADPTPAETEALDLPSAGMRPADVESCGSTLTGVVRDFQKSHPDFEDLDAVGKCFCTDTAIIGPTLGPDQKPVYVGNPDTVSTTGADNFQHWFNDVPGVNMSQPLQLVFTPTESGALTYQSAEFFPVDDQLLGNEGLWHNFSFTFELHTTFLYRGFETFTFRGDDDVFAYINGQLVVNLGGVHDVQEATVVLANEEQRLGLVVGQVHALDFFFAERHCCASNFRIDTSLEFVSCGSIR